MAGTGALSELETCCLGKECCCASCAFFWEEGESRYRAYEVSSVTPCFASPYTTTYRRAKDKSRAKLTFNFRISYLAA